MNTARDINILLVEDAEEHAVLVKRALNSGKLKPRIFWVTDGKAALDFLYNRGNYTNKEANPRPDLVLLDLKLPKLHGLKVLEHVKSDEILRDIPVVILTASDEGKDIIESCKGGAAGYFTKSVLLLNKDADPTVILDTVMTMVGV